MNTTKTVSPRPAVLTGMIASSLIFLGCNLTALADAPAPGASAEQTLQLPSFEVTGSHIARLEGEGPQPVTAFSGTQIADSGFASLGDFLQAQSFNSGAQGSLMQISATGVGVAFARGASTLNPRGLGAGNFLVLVNGRRATNFANPDSNGSSVFDFNSIPAEAVESVDFLKDGASAIYGSDAITGVMNIRLKKNFNGVAVETMAGNTFGHDTLSLSANVLAGSASDKNTVLVDVNWHHQLANFIRDYTPNFNLAPVYGPVKGTDLNSTQNYPTNVNLSASQALAAGLTTGAGYYVISGGQPTATPTVASFTNVGAAANIPLANQFNPAQTEGLNPLQNNLNAIAYLTHDFNDRVQAYGQIVAADEKTEFTYTPTPISTASVLVSPSFQSAIPNNTQGGAANTYLIVPASNPYNPFGVNLTSFLSRANFGAPRIFDAESETGSFLAGLKGKLLGDWKWDSAFTYGYSLYTQNERNVIRADDLQNALNGTLFGNNGVYLNPFGPSSPALVKALLVSSLGEYRSTGLDYDASANGPVFALPAGEVELAVGGEWHKDTVVGAPDTTNLVGTTNGLPFTGSRSVTSEYVELDAPIIKQYLELQVAARHENYTAFGQTTKQKLAFVSQPLSFLKLRGSYSQSFKAPDLGQLYGGSLNFSAATTDPLNPGVASQQYKELTSANPNLKPEQGKNLYGGVVIDAGKLVHGLSMTIDYTNITINNAIVPTSTLTTAQIFTYFPGLVVRNPANNQISYFNLTPFNGTAYYYRGFDFGLDYKLPKTPVGTFAISSQATRILYLAYNPGTGQGILNESGHYGLGGENERWSSNSTFSWSEQAFAASLTWLWKGPVTADANASATAPAWGVNPISLFNGQVSWDGPLGVKVTVGCDNFLGTKPPENGRISGDGFDVASYGAWAMGRFGYVKLAKKF